MTVKSRLAVRLNVIVGGPVELKDEQIIWEWVRSEAGPDLRLFRTRFDWVRNHRNGYLLKATVLEAPDWVNVVALTPAGKIVVVRQYRFGTQEVTTEIPAGIVEDGEETQAAAIRELREETGYTSKEWEYLGYVEPNPAFLTNRCHHWLARNARQESSPALDEGESLVICEMSVDEVGQEIVAGRMRHALAVTALAHVFDLRTWLAAAGR